MGEEAGVKLKEWVRKRGLVGVGWVVGVSVKDRKYGLRWDDYFAMVD